ncbi:MAG: TPM domain-containing protein [Candidatus Binatia bacterium]
MAEAATAEDSGVVAVADSEAEDSAVAAVVLAGAALQAGGRARDMDAEKIFSEEDKKRINQAVVTAEQKTSGEIVPMVVTASARYTEIELFGLIIGLGIGTLAAAIFGDPWRHDFAYLWPMLGAAAGFFICRIPAIKRRLLPSRRRDDAVLQRSLAAFAAEGLHHTREHTGILILISLLEREVEVLADRGINEKVPPGTWDEVVQIMTAGLKSGKAGHAFCKAIERCGAILAEHFPRAADDTDELSNRLVTGE